MDPFIVKIFKSGHVQFVWDSVMMMRETIKGVIHVSVVFLSLIIPV